MNSEQRFITFGENEISDNGFHALYIFNDQNRRRIEKLLLSVRLGILFIFLFIYFLLFGVCKQ